MSSTINLVDFIGIQEQNIIGGLINLGDDFKYAGKLDQFYGYPLNFFSASQPGDGLIGSLYLDTHKHYCLSMANFFRNSISVSWMVTRKAIEHTLSAYYLCRYPATEEIYCDRSHDRYKEIFYNIKRFMKDNEEEFPLSRGLCLYHELMSKNASHSTVEAHYMHRETIIDQKANTGEVRVHYSEVLNFHKEYLPHYFVLLNIYFFCYELFWKELFSKRIKISTTEHDNEQKTYHKELKMLMKKHPTYSENSN
jgi:hypothetical protein